MNTLNFQNLIQSITKRELIIDTTDNEIINGKEYFIYKYLPITQRYIGLKFIAPKTDEKMLRAFITAFTNKYKEPDPKAYNKNYGGIDYTWESKTDKEKEYAYMHHATNMFYKTELLKQIEDNFNTQDIENTLLRYGFYSTEYGIGIFCFWETEYVINAINKMKAFLNSQNIPFKNEYSDARWVYRFKINLTKEAHYNLIKSFN